MKNLKYIPRAMSPILTERLSKAKCLLLTGARQVGKSTLIKHDFKTFNYVNFDDKIARIQAHDDPKLFFINNPAPLFIDEVQKEEELLESLKMILDNSDARGQYILSGSQSLHLLKNMSESLAGRVSIMELNCLSLRELYNVSFNTAFVPTKDYIAQREKHLKHYDGIWKTIHRGMYPELHQIDRDWEDFYQSYITTYIERDINEIINSDSVTFTKFLIACAARTGQVLNYSNISNEVEVSVPTIKNWISVLERTGIIYLLQPYTANTLKRAIKSPKLYFRDTGLACYLTGWATAKTIQNSSVAGNMFETFVVNEIIKSYTNAGKNYRMNIFYYRRKGSGEYGDSEIDLIIEENGILHPVEIKLTANPKAQMASANKILDSVENKKRGLGTIVCLIDKKMYLRENLIALPLDYV